MFTKPPFTAKSEFAVAVESSELKEALKTQRMISAASPSVQKSQTSKSRVTFRTPEISCRTVRANCLLLHEPMRCSEMLARMQVRHERSRRRYLLELHASHISSGIDSDMTIGRLTCTCLNQKIIEGRMFFPCSEACCSVASMTMVRYPANGMTHISCTT